MKQTTQLIPLFLLATLAVSHPVAAATKPVRVAGLVAEEVASVIGIAHDRAFATDDLTTVKVHCVVETRDAQHIARLRDRLKREGFRVGAE
ncbi:MAG: hypothetical protein MUF81_18235 [Verrucomicrobia bacterium]|jgi:hypothetical protein|nr:hypothetical protein [Verrucomicrobiota bacterium]